MNYAFAGLVIDCDIALPELAPASAPADCVVRSGHIDWLRPERVVHTWRGASGSTAVLTIARRGDGFTLQFGETARFLVGARGESIVVEPASIDSSATLRHLLLDQVLPLAISARGDIVLHAAAVGIGGGAVGLLGHTGAGKSTLAAQAARMANGSVIADDCLRVRLDSGTRIAYAVPSYEGSRLWPDAIAATDLGERPTERVADYSQKRRVRVTDGCAWREMPLLALYLLDEAPANGAITIAPVGGSEAVMTVVEHAFRLDPTDRHTTAGEFTRLTALAATCPVKRLSYPRTFEQLPSAAQIMIEDLLRTRDASGAEPLCGARSQQSAGTLRNG